MQSSFPNEFRTVLEASFMSDEKQTNNPAEPKKQGVSSPVEDKKGAVLNNSEGNAANTLNSRNIPDFKNQVHMVEGEDLTLGIFENSYDFLLTTYQKILYGLYPEVKWGLDIMGDKAILASEKTKSSFDNNIKWPFDPGKKVHVRSVFWEISKGKGIAIKACGNSHDPIFEIRSPYGNINSRGIYYGANFGLILNEFINGQLIQKLALEVLGEPLDAVTIPLQIIKIKEVVINEERIPIEEYFAYERYWYECGIDYQTVRNNMIDIILDRHRKKSCLEKSLKQSTNRSITEKFLEDPIVQLRSFAPTDLRLTAACWLYNPKSYLDLIWPEDPTDLKENLDMFNAEKWVIDSILRKFYGANDQRYVPLDVNGAKKYLSDQVLKLKLPGLPRDISYKPIDSQKYLRDAFYHNRQAATMALCKAAQRTGRLYGLTLCGSWDLSELLWPRNLIGGSVGTDLDDTYIPIGRGWFIRRGWFNNQETNKAKNILHRNLRIISRRLLLGDNYRSICALPWILGIDNREIIVKARKEFIYTARETLAQVREKVLYNPQQGLFSLRFIEEYSKWLKGLEKEEVHKGTLLGKILNSSSSPLMSISGAGKLVKYASEVRRKDLATQEFRFWRSLLFYWVEQKIVTLNNIVYSPQEKKLSINGKDASFHKSRLAIHLTHVYTDSELLDFLSWVEERLQYAFAQTQNEFPQLKRVVISGSFGEGKPTIISDIDIVLDMENPYMAKKAEPTFRSHFFSSGIRYPSFRIDFLRLSERYRCLLSYDGKAYVDVQKRTFSSLVDFCTSTLPSSSAMNITQGARRKAQNNAASPLETKTGSSSPVVVVQKLKSILAELGWKKMVAIGVLLLAVGGAGFYALKLSSMVPAQAPKSHAPVAATPRQVASYQLAADLLEQRVKKSAQVLLETYPVWHKVIPSLSLADTTELKTILEKMTQKEFSINVVFDPRFPYIMAFNFVKNELLVDGRRPDELSDLELEALLLHESVHMLKRLVIREKETKEKMAYYKSLESARLSLEKEEVKKTIACLIANEIEAYVADFSYRVARGIDDLPHYLLHLAAAMRDPGLKSTYEKLATLVDKPSINMDALISFALEILSDDYKRIVMDVFVLEGGNRNASFKEVAEWVLSWIRAYNAALQSRSSSSPVVLNPAPIVVKPYMDAPLVRSSP